jgi:hypothetical protein
MQNQQSPADNIRKQWTTNWHMQKDKKSAVSKLSSSGDSIKTICSQLTLQQQQNKKLIDLTEKLKEDSKKELEMHHQQMTEHDQNGRSTWTAKLQLLQSELNMKDKPLRQQPTKKSNNMKQ